jgi:hypothetical protein
MSAANTKQKPEVDSLTQQLATPFELTEVKFRPAMVTGNRAMALAYVDARVIQDRLDDVLGVAGWQDDYECREDGSVVCRLRLRLGDEWITKVDVGGPSEQPDGGDRLKAAFSDALKRAAVKFGIGRYLYRVPALWVDYDPKKKAFLQTPRLPAFALPERTKTLPVAEPRRAAPPVTGEEFVRRLQQYDAKLTGQGMCTVGDLIKHVTEAGIKTGYDADLTKWTPAQVAFAGEQARQFEAQRRKPKRREVA